MGEGLLEGFLDGRLTVEEGGAPTGQEMAKRCHGLAGNKKCGSPLSVRCDARKQADTAQRWQWLAGIEVALRVR